MKGAPDFQKAASHFPPEHSETPPAPRPRAASLPALRARASPPQALPGRPQVQSQGGLAARRPLARNLLPLRPDSGS